MRSERWFQVLTITFGLLNLACAVVVIELLRTLGWPAWPTRLVLLLFLPVGVLAVLAAIRAQRGGRTLWWRALAISLAEEPSRSMRGSTGEGAI